MKYRATYTYSRPYGRPHHDWTVVSAMAAINLHISDSGPESKYERYSGGIEMHYRYPPDYMADSPPSHDQCHALKAPCWHDGSSMQATDYWIPLWLSMPHEPDAMFEQLYGDLIDKLKGQTWSVMQTLSSLKGVNDEI